MTALTPTTPPLGRVWRIARLLTTNPWTVIGWPLAILAAIFVMNWTIWWLIFLNLDASQASDTAAGVQYNGAVTFIFVYMLIVAVQAVNLTFPLALGYGSTRRSFSLGAGLTFLLLSVGYATIMTLGAALEEATDGWGLRGAFFRTVLFRTDEGWPAQWWIYFCWLVFFFALGTVFAAVFVRWRAFGLTASLLVSGVLLIAAIALLTITDGWNAFGESLATLGTVGVPTVLLAPALVAAVLGYLILRWATPRS